LPVFARSAGRTRRNRPAPFLPEGERIFSEGMRGAGFYAILAGRSRFFKVSAEGIAILHLFGRRLLRGGVRFHGQGFPADAAAMSATTALFFPRGAFIRLIKDDPALALNMMRSCAAAAPVCRSHRGSVAQGGAGPAREVSALSEAEGQRRGGTGRFQGQSHPCWDDSGDPLPILSKMNRQG